MDLNPSHQVLVLNLGLEVPPRVVVLGILVQAFELARYVLDVVLIATQGLVDRFVVGGQTFDSLTGASKFMLEVLLC